MDPNLLLHIFLPIITCLHQVVLVFATPQGQINEDNGNLDGMHVQVESLLDEDDMMLPPLVTSSLEPFTPPSLLEQIGPPEGTQPAATSRPTVETANMAPRTSTSTRSSTTAGTRPIEASTTAGTRPIDRNTAAATAWPTLSPTRTSHSEPAHIATTTQSTLTTAQLQIFTTRRTETETEKQPELIHTAVASSGNTFLHWHRFFGHFMVSVIFATFCTML